LLERLRRQARHLLQRFARAERSVGVAMQHEGRTVAIEYRWAEGSAERFADIAAEFVLLARADEVIE
jgi:hypothetical protein